MSKDGDQNRMEKEGKGSLKKEDCTGGKAVSGLVGALEERSKRLVESFKVQKQINKKLTEENGKAREQIGKLVGMVEGLKLENAKLKRQLMKAGMREELQQAQVWAVTVTNQEEQRAEGQVGNVIDVDSMIKVIKILAKQSQWGNHPSVLMTCRLVSRNWKQAVDTFLQEETPIFPSVPFKELGKPEVPLIFNSERIPWSDDPMITSMTSEMNPFPGRYLLYTDDVRCPLYKNGRQQLRRKLLEFLQRFGHHVWYFKVAFSRRASKFEGTAWCVVLRKFLGLMPNLKALYLCQPMFGWWTEDGYDYPPGGHHQDLEMEQPGVTIDSDICFVPNSRRLELLNIHLQVNGCPSIKTLETAVLEDCPPSFMESFLKSNPQLQRFQIKRNWNNKVEFNMSPIEMENLHELSLSCYRIVCNDFDKISWKLRKLTMNSPNVDWPILFGVLENSLFAQGLLELDLYLQGPWTGNGAHLMLDLPNLKILKLEINRCFNPIDFILQLFNLEELSVDLTGMHPKQKVLKSGKHVTRDRDYKLLSEIEGLINLSQLIYEPKNSDIWEYLPELKKIRARADEGCVEDISPPSKEHKWYFCSREQVGKH